jgi:lysozyme
MTTPFLMDDLKRDEGLRLTAYPDPDTDAAPWTIGYGHTGPEVHRGLTWTQDQAETALTADVAAVIAQLNAALPWWRSLDDARQDVLANMAFNMGLAGLQGFKVFLADCQMGRFGLAAAQMLMSRWAEEVGERAMRLSILMEHGARA